jgi:hypothetical protein
LTHSLESAWFQPLSLLSENLVLKICFFKWVNLYRCTSAHRNATSPYDLDATLEAFVDSFNNASLPI